MKKILFIILCVLVIDHIKAQELITPSSVVVSKNKLTIYYKLNGTANQKKDIQIWFEDKNKRKIVPVNLMGDVKKVSPGLAKKIIWEFSPNEKYKKKYSIHLISHPAKNTHFITNSKESAFVVDNDLNVYNTVIIGGKTWMAENLKVTTFNNGDPIPLSSEADYWAKSSPNSAYIKYDSLTYADYGLMYNWTCINDPRRVCPQGWHIPKESELRMLFQNDSKAQGFIVDKLNINDSIVKQVSVNKSGFSALSTGFLNEFGKQTNLKTNAVFWSSSVYFEAFSCNLKIDWKNDQIEISKANKMEGAAVRCLKD